jgi:Immunoglobulin-like domain of bacterial spore germination
VNECRAAFAWAGCSSTFEASVNWRLRDRAGEALASGVTQGGSLEPSSFEFTVEYSIAAGQIGELEVYEPRVTTEGFPPSRDVVRLILNRADLVDALPTVACPRAVDSRT